MEFKEGFFMVCLMLALFILGCFILFANEKSSKIASSICASASAISSVYIAKNMYDDGLSKTNVIQFIIFAIIALIGFLYSSVDSLNYLKYYGVLSMLVPVIVAGYGIYLLYKWDKGIRNSIKEGQQTLLPQ